MSQHPSTLTSLPGPSLLNEYLEDKGKSESLILGLQEAISIFLPDDVLKDIEPALVRFGNKVASDYLEPSIDAEQNPPQLQQYSPTGE